MAEETHRYTPVYFPVCRAHVKKKVCSSEKSLNLLIGLGIMYVYIVGKVSNLKRRERGEGSHKNPRKPNHISFSARGPRK